MLCHFCVNSVPGALGGGAIKGGGGGAVMEAAVRGWGIGGVDSAPRGAGRGQRKNGGRSVGRGRLYTPCSQTQPLGWRYDGVVLALSRIDEDGRIR